MSATRVILARELKSYFATPLAYVFIVVFLFLCGFFTFWIGDFFERGQADLATFFTFHPWLYLFLIPAVSMRLWAEERKTGTVEVLLTLPVTMAQAVLGKFLAAWAFTGIVLALTFPLWITVNALGDPDNGVIVASYLGSLLMAGAYLAIGAAISAFTRNQVIALVVTVVVLLFFLLPSLTPVISLFSGWAPPEVLDAVQSISFVSRFDAITKGVIDLRDIVYFASLIALALFGNAIVIDQRKAD